MDNKFKFDKCTPLHCAATVGCVITTKYLIQTSVNVNAALSGKSPLHYAVLNDTVDCVKILLQASACSNSQVFLYYDKIRTQSDGEVMSDQKSLK